MVTDHRLYYTTPSASFQTSLPLGNGRLGASVLSSAAGESFILNEITFCSGAPYSAGSGLKSRPQDPKAELRKTQQCFLANQFSQGKKRTEEFLESKKCNFGTNLGIGRLDITVAGHDDQDSIRGFERELRLDEAVAETRYERGQHRFRRRCFVSYPHQVLVIIVEGDGKDELEITVELRGENDSFTTTSVNGDRLEFTSQALEDVHSDGTSGVKGHGMIAASVDDGRVESKNESILATGRKTITILVAFNTDYGQSDEGWRQRSSDQIEAASKLSTAQLFSMHLFDFQPLYHRTSISLGTTSASSGMVPVDQRRKNFEPSAYNDPGMFALYFHYTRYLTIAGTRATSPLPLHLQGLWNDGEACRMGWSCDYHLDINTQMNYFAVLPSALSELMQPLVSYLKSLAAAGRDAARVCCGCDGWVAHVFSNIWGFADPGWETTYGLNVTGGLWLASHLIELYEYTLDDGFLEHDAYPVLKGAAEFFLDYMIEHPDTGWLLTGPAISPENSFFVAGEDNRKEEHYLSLSPTLDVTLIRDLFAFCVHAASHLGKDSDLVERLQTAQMKLPPYQIGKHGQLQEWLHDYEEAQPFHRHLSHTMALCRSSQISVRHTPALAEAVNVTLERRQGRDDLEDIEFTAALFGLNYARLGNAGKALAQIGHLIGELSFDNLLSYSKPGVAGAEKNIFVADGNFGGAAVIAEMLVRSVMLGPGGPVEMDLLPALPAMWPEGTVRGLRLRGNLEIDMEWSHGKLNVATLKAHSPVLLTVYYQEHNFQASHKVGDVINLSSTLQVV